jgi:uncharacterized membrane protein
MRGLYAASFALYSCLLVHGIAYYLTPYHERPHHVEYRVLRPAVLAGHTFGVIGSFFMICMLSYSLRKRARSFRTWGRLSNWLDVHIFFGIFGPLLVVLHTTFKVQGLVAVSFWSMVAVALSGIFGRFLYLQIPRNIQGDELSVKELDQLSRDHSVRLQKEFGLSPEVMRSLEERSLKGMRKDSGPLHVL